MGDGNIYVKRLFRIRKDLLSEFRSLVSILYPDCYKGEITRQLNQAIENHIKLMRLDVPMPTRIKGKQ